MSIDKTTQFAATISKISIGTANFGLKYGFGNNYQKIDISSARKILGKAKHLGLKKIDTAFAYGDAEEILGEIGVREYQITTKIDQKSFGTLSTPKQIRSKILESMKRLKVDEIYALLAHNVSTITDSENFAIAAFELKKDGYIQKIGCSIYDPLEIEKIENSYTLDVYQIPLNIVDQRFVPVIENLQRSGKIIQARSVFLQGVLLEKDLKRIPEILKQNQTLQDWIKIIGNANMDPVKLCIDHVLTTKGIDSVVFGLDSQEQLEQIVKKALSPVQEFNFRSKNDPGKLLDPRLWDKLG
jgi:aryl-alcohol dehydrogenase-like predicted oxidoreductase